MLFGRRVTFALVVLASQILLIGLSLTFFTELIIIMRSGSVNLIERNLAILILEAVLSGLITVLALVVIILQARRLGERRKGDSGPHLRRG